MVRTGVSLADSVEQIYAMMDTVEARNRTVAGNKDMARRNGAEWRETQDRQGVESRRTDLHSSITHNALRLFGPPTATTISTPKVRTTKSPRYTTLNPLDNRTFIATKSH
jgi:hypothetical protein